MGSNQLPDGAALIAPAGERTFERIIEYFKAQMVDGTLKPGDRLLSERELAERLGISRPSLREALRTLQMLGLVDIRPGQGSFISSPDYHALASVFGITLSLQPSAASSILEARIAIECEAIRLACQRATAQDLSIIERALAEIPRGVTDPELGAQTDFEFHTAIVRASHSEVLLLLYESLEALLRRSHQERRQAAYNDASFLDTLGPAHRALYDAVVARDSEEAESQMRRHFSLLQEYYASKDVTGADDSTR